MLVLAVELNQPAGEFLQRASGGQLTVHERAAATLARDLSADEALFPTAVENGLDGRGRLSRPDEVARRAAAEQKAHGFDQNRFAGTGLASQDVQAGVKLQFDRIDDRKVFNPEKAEHRERERTPILT